jgi:hypothetical protein
MVGCLSPLLEGPLRPLRLADRRGSARAALAPCDGPAYPARHAPFGADCTGRAAAQPTSQREGAAQVAGQVADQAHVLLRLVSGQTIRAARAPLAAASAVIRDALACDQAPGQGFGAQGPGPASDPAAKGDGPCLPVSVSVPA